MVLYEPARLQAVAEAQAVVILLFATDVLL